MTSMVLCLAQGRQAWDGSCSWEVTHNPQTPGIERKKLGLMLTFGTSEDHSSGRPFPTRLRPLILPKQFCQLVTNHSNIWIYGFHFHLKHHHDYIVLEKKQALDKEYFYDTNLCLLMKKELIYGERLIIFMYFILVLHSTRSKTAKMWSF